MAALHSGDEELYMMSNGLYRILNFTIGSEDKIGLLRQSIDTTDCFVSRDTNDLYQYVISGSRAEGFNLNSSDVDIMAVNRYITVLKNTHCKVFNINFHSVLLMETRGIPPGFTLLKCLEYDISDNVLCNSLVSKGGEMYVSNLVRERFMYSNSTTVHGPCVSGESVYGVEFDIAYTLKCPFWPEQAESFIHRSIKRGWPCIDVLAEIIRDGCLLVPINSKQETQSDITDLEWRISFSIAEKKLIYSMNHSQFLCYGLLKIFLNEILKKMSDINDLMCSYFMKTAVFWEISERRDEWSTLSFIAKFWNLFRRILKWVSIGYCPNFFIPEHNMFKTKIYGVAQRNLMTRLRSLYEEGYLCLLRCESFTELLSMCIYAPFVFNNPAIMDIFYKFDHRIEMQMIFDTCNTTYSPTALFDISDKWKRLYSTAALIPTSDVMSLILKLRMNRMMQEIAVDLYSDLNVNQEVIKSNKLRNQNICIAKSLFKKTKTSFCMSEMKFASCAYINGEYKKTIQIVHSIKQRLQRWPYMYKWNLNTDVITESRQLGMSYDKILNHFVLDTYMYFPRGNYFIDELKLELIASIDKNICGLMIPPLVFLNLLLILSYIRLDEVHCLQDVMSELQSLIWYDDGYHIPERDKAISWEILGICQQLCGDYHGAYQSYVNAFIDQYNYFQPATLARINSLNFG